MYYVYILKCSDFSFYVGFTKNLSQRIDAHNKGKGSIYTKQRLPVKLIYFEKYQEENKAKLREVQIKKYSSKNKMKLITYGLGIKVSLANK